MYKIEYLPIARMDMIEIVRYIRQEIGNPDAAERLAEQFIEKAENLVEFPYINPVHMPIRPLKHEYRKLILGHYIMFYWVDEKRKLVTIARVIYAKMDYTKKLE